jgi:hypothetical protein
MAMTWIKRDFLVLMAAIMQLELGTSTEPAEPTRTMMDIARHLLLLRVSEHLHPLWHCHLCKQAAALNCRRL